MSEGLYNVTTHSLTLCKAAFTLHGLSYDDSSMLLGAQVLHKLFNVHYNLPKNNE